eukprot:IDg757t1
MITRQGDTLKLSQQKYARTLVLLSPSKFTPDGFARLRGQLSYIANSTRPDASFSSAQLAQVKAIDATATDARSLNSAVSFIQKMIELGMIIVLADDKGKASIIHYASWKCRRVTRSVLAAESYSSGEISNIGHILSEFNPADPLTKKMNSPLLSKLLETGIIDHPVNQWIIHNDSNQN